MSVAKPQGREQNREAWLQAAVVALTPMFGAINVQLPPVRVSVGWPKSRGKGKAIGQCWHSISAQDGVNQIFISPEIAEATRVLDILMHELTHASDDGESKHRGHFKRTAQQLGLVEPWTATTAGEQLAPLLQELAKQLGPYPHAALTQVTAVGKKQTTRMIKLVAVECCDYTARTTAKWIEVGLPTCPHGADMAPADARPEGE